MPREILDPTPNNVATQHFKTKSGYTAKVISRDAEDNTIVHGTIRDEYGNMACHSWWMHDGKAIGTNCSPCDLILGD